MKPDSFAISYCYGGEYDGFFGDSLMRVIDHDLRNRRLLSGLLNQRGLYIAWNRNRIVKQFLALPETEWLWSLDSDMLFEPDIIYRLIDSARAHDAKIMSAVYFGFPQA